MRALAELERLVRQHAAVCLACEPTTEGALTVVGLTYLAHADGNLVRTCPQTFVQPRLGEATIPVVTDVDLARRVYCGFERSVTRGCTRRRAGRCPSGCLGGCVSRIAYAAASDDERMPQAILDYMRLGFASGSRLRDLTSDPVVCRAEALARATRNECERMRQFVRFSEQSDGSLLAMFRPKADVLVLAGGYFVARLSTERFCLVDPLHRIALLHDPSQGSAYVRLDRDAVDRLVRGQGPSCDERYVRAMWKRFYDGLELPGRDATHRGYDLRTQLMPKRLWEGLPELDPRTDDPGPFVPRRYRQTPGTSTGALPAGGTPVKGTSCLRALDEAEPHD
jgi:probable DNA metabolism protein